MISFECTIAARADRNTLSDKHELPAWASEIYGFLSWVYQNDSLVI